jgi:hypothetical protein
MNSYLYIGIVSKKNMLEIATRESGKTASTMTFPATGMGIEALRHFLDSCGNPVRLAVAGAAALSIALALGNVPLRETFIVSSTVASQAADLARYAENAV